MEELGSFEQVEESRTPVDAGVIFRLRLEATAVAKELVDVEYRNVALRLLKEVGHAGDLADLLAANLLPTVDDKQRVLETADPFERVNLLLQQVQRIRAVLPGRRSFWRDIRRWFRPR
ncbi:MAG: hypothetical protein E6J65_09320 [Deltaproteobacteria bacterium]|nr:MAG: hypothetical protein E6J65_09320 [Deltaproteobacteria bacterium]